MVLILDLDGNSEMVSRRDEQFLLFDLFKSFD